MSKAKLERAGRRKSERYIQVTHRIYDCPTFRSTGVPPFLWTLFDFDGQSPSSFPR